MPGYVPLGHRGAVGGCPEPPYGLMDPGHGRDQARCNPVDPQDVAVEQTGDEPFGIRLPVVRIIGQVGDHIEHHVCDEKLRLGYAGTLGNVSHRDTDGIGTT